MARLRDVPRVIGSIGVWTFVKRVYQQISEDRVFTWASALAYSWMFAIFPFVIFLLSLIPLIPPQYASQTQTYINDTIQGVFPRNTADTLEREVNRLFESDQRKGLLSFGLLLAIWAASGGMNATMAALDECYDIEKRRPFYRQRLLAMLLTVIFAAMVIIVIILLPVCGLVIDYLKGHGLLPWGSVWLLNITRYAIAMLLLFAALSLIYTVGPSIRRKFRFFSAGSVFVIVVWILIGWAFKLYVNGFGGAESYSKTYGTVGGIALLLLIFYVDALVLLVGAEINSEIEFAILGMPSDTTTEEGKKTVPGIPLDDDDKLLAEELKKKRADVGG
jgi:membrane protein